MQNEDEKKKKKKAHSAHVRHMRRPASALSLRAAVRRPAPALALRMGLGAVVRQRAAVERRG